MFPQSRLKQPACSSAQALSLTIVGNKVFYRLMFTPGRRSYLWKSVSGESPASTPRMQGPLTPPCRWRWPRRTRVTKGKGAVTSGRENWGRLSAQGWGEMVDLLMKRTECFQQDDNTGQPAPHATARCSQSRAWEGAPSKGFNAAG